MSQLTLQLLGGVTLQRDGQPLAGLPSRKAVALLIYLACVRHAVAREVLADLLWDDRPHEQALANLRTLLPSLRRTLNDALLIERDDLAFNRQSAYTLDVEQFEAHLAASRADDEAALGHLQAAMALYQGDFLRGFHLRQSRGFEEWATLERERLHRLAVLAMRRLVQNCLERADYARGIEQAARLLQLDSLSEEAHRYMMLLQARTGQRTAALAQYETCRRLLAAELDVTPTEETAALYARIRSAQTLGTHNLPPPMTDFIGREAECQTLTTRLARPAGRLITLLGPGGIGKTRLAVETARQISAQRPGLFLHGLCFVPLLGLHSAHFLAATLTEALAVPGASDPKTRLLDYLREREILLILDNFEHLLGEDGAGLDLLTEMLTQAPMVKILVTSRERLNLQEEELFNVSGLDVPAGDEIAPETYSAGQLFIANVRRVQHDFAPSNTESRAIVRICRLMSGAPLAIELAAASVPASSCVEIAATLEGNLDQLTSTLRNAPERHRSLRAAFEHSWGRLSGEAQIHFARLSIFPETFTAEAALAAAEVNVAALNQLANKSLLQRQGERYHIHPLLRQYAAEKLAAWPTIQTAVGAGHCQYYAEYLGQRTAWLMSGRQRQIMQEVGAEISNVRAAWEHALVHHSHTAIGQMLDSLNFFYVTRGWLQEGSEVCQRALTHLTGEAVPDATLIARVQARQAECELWLSNFEQAQTLLQASTATLREQSAWSPLAWAYDLWSTLEYDQGHYAEARRYAEVSLALFRQLDDRLGVAQVLNNLANILCDESAAYHEADRLYEESLTVYQQLDDAFGQAKCLINLGSTAQMRDEFDRARTFYEQGIALCRANDNGPTLAIALTNLGQLLSKLGQHAEAEKCLLESLELKRQSGNRRSLVFSLKRLGTVATRLSQLSSAKDYFDEALRISRQLKSATLLADVLIGVAGLLNRRGHTPRALELLAAIQRHAANDQEILNEATAQFTEFSQLVTPEMAAACRTRGEARDLEKLAAELLSEPVQP